MDESLNEDLRQPFVSGWRPVLLCAAFLAPLVVMMLFIPRIVQDQNYHNFADQRSLFGIPNFGDVMSNLGFLIVGIAGLWVAFTHQLGRMRSAWIVMFGGLALVGVASGYYHWYRTDYSLAWDRMALTVGFMGMFVALVGEYVSNRLNVLLAPAVLVGVGTVLYWQWFDDLRLYYWIQMAPLIVIPAMMALYRPKYSRQWLVFAGIFWYGLAKLAELGDRTVFSATGELISGHTVKHLLAAAGSATILWAVYKRKPLNHQGVTAAS